MSLNTEITIKEMAFIKQIMIEICKVHIPDIFHILVRYSIQYGNRLVAAKTLVAPIANPFELLPRSEL